MFLDYLSTSFGRWGKLSCRFFWPEASPNGSSLEEIPTLLLLFFKRYHSENDE